MLAHQMAASHLLAMKFLARAAKHCEERSLLDKNQMPVLEVVRMSNATRSLMDSFQNAALTIQKLRTGGKQKILVQHVHMNDQSQAVIANDGSRLVEDNED